MRSLYLVLIACFFQGINGIISETECLDNSESVCNGLQEQCTQLSYLYTCPETCGVCKAICKDYNANCFNEDSQCTINENHAKECPKTCATCDVCEDLIDSSICENKKSDCADNHMKYVCKKTCKYCEDTCNDVASNELCKSHVSRGDCENNEAVKRMCRKSCNFCEIEQC
ncbi:uncharacterized protein [Lepeophtheirus salmonis]|uniref:uncharacterized protein n=1 Tax=Lepeophtheirus salmonis TaxID=72036 RepID=UPI001AE318A6|nr:uncharacterized protein ZK643.6-like [Lepeophtheirus salmonis]